MENKHNTWPVATRGRKSTIRDQQLTTDADTLVPSIDTLTHAVTPFIGANALTRATEKLIWFATRVVHTGDHV